MTATVVAVDPARAAAQTAINQSGASVAVDATPTSAAAKHQIVIEVVGGDRILALNRPLGHATANVDVIVSTKTDENFSDLEPHLTLVKHVETVLQQASWTDGDITIHNVIPDVAFSGTQPPDDGSDSWLLVRTLSFQIIYSDASGLPDAVASF